MNITYINKNISTTFLFVFAIVVSTALFLSLVNVSEARVVNPGKACGNAIVNGVHITRYFWPDPPPPPDRCPDLPEYPETVGYQSRIPDGFVRQWGHCVPSSGGGGGGCSSNSVEINGACSPRLEAVCTVPSSVEVGSTAKWTTELARKVPRNDYYEWTGDILNLLNGKTSRVKAPRIDTTSTGSKLATLITKSNHEGGGVNKTYGQEDTVTCTTDVIPKQITGKCTVTGTDPNTGRAKGGVGTVGKPVTLYITQVKDWYTGNTGGRDSVTKEIVYRSYDFSGDYTHSSGSTNATSYRVKDAVFNSPGLKNVSVNISSTRSNVSSGTISCPVLVCEEGSTNCVYTEPPTITASINPTLVNQGGVCTISYASPDATRCVLRQGGNEVRVLPATSGDTDVSEGAYQIRCYTSEFIFTDSNTLTCNLNPDVREN